MIALKTIVVHFTSDERADELLRISLKLAQEHDAHLVGLFVTFAEIPSPWIGAGKALIDTSRAMLKSRSDAIRARFEAGSAAHGIRSEWRYVEPKRRVAIDVLLQHARCADLIIASQADEGHYDTSLVEYPEELLLDSGRPVLLVPTAGSFPSLGERVTIAWNDRREAARAAFDALPLLRKASDVRVLWVNPESEADGTPTIPTADIVKALSRHGIPCTAAAIRGADIDVGNVLLNDIADSGTTLLVMGGYGRRRIRELVFGGATRVILRSMTVPVLLSH